MNSSFRAINETELLENFSWVQVLARRLVVDRATADDVVQDTCLAALEHPPRLGEGAVLRAWLSRVTRTMARQHRRAEAQRARREHLASRGEAVPSAHDVVARAAIQHRLVAAVMELGEPDRSTVLLRYLDGLSARAIAERQGETSAAVRQRLSRARGRLRGRLERELGDERLSALVPFAFAGAGKSVFSVLGTLGGGALVTKTTMTIGIGAVAVVIGGIAWLYAHDDGLPPKPSRPAEARVALVTPDAPAETSPAAEALAPAPEESATGRASLPTEDVLAGAVYEVLDPDGRTLAEARVALCAEGGVLTQGRTDETGRFATELDRDEEGKILVVAEGWAPQVHAVSLAALRHEVYLSGGETVSGWIVVDGHTPADVIPLHLRADRGYVDLQEDLGLGRDALESVWEPRRGTKTRTATDGSFLFAGLPAGWSGTINLPSEYRVRDQIDAASDYRLSSVRLNRAEQGLRIDVVRRHVLYGRVVDFPDGSAVPVEGAFVTANLAYAGGPPGTSPQSRERTDADGRFRIPLLSLSIEWGFLALAPPDGEFDRYIDVAPMELEGSYDLGDLALVDLEAKYTVSLRMQSEDGDPIPGAVAGTDRESPISDPSDEAGRTSLRGVVPGKSTIVVYAAGWEVTTVDLPNALADETVITMRRGTTLELRFRTPDGKHADQVTARVWADVHPYRDDAPITIIEGYKSARCTWYQTVHPEDGTVVVRLRAGQDSDVLLNDVRPGVPLRLRVEGFYGATVHHQDIAPLSPEEWKVVDVDLPRSPLTLHGRVVNEAGEPLPSAGFSVSFTAPDSPPNVGLAVGTSVDENGEFRITGIYEPDICLTVRADGYVPYRDESYEVPTDEQPVEFQLASARIVTVTLQDEEGHPVEGRVRSDLPSGSWVLAHPVVDEPGTYLLRGLPEHEVVIKATVHDAEYEQLHDPLVPSLTFTVPIYGEVTVTIVASGDVALDQSCWLRFLPIDNEDLFARIELLPPGGFGSLTVPSVIPGRYEAVVQRYLGEADGEAQWEDVSTRVPFVVGPVRPTSVTVEL